MTDQVTGTRDATFNIVSILYHALQGAETCAQYEKDAVDDEDLRRFFQQAQGQQRELADAAKRVLRERLERAPAGEPAAFSFGRGSADAETSPGQSTAASEI
jgi:hypothetical protein